MTDLIDWLRQQIAKDAEEWRLWLSGPRAAGKGIARDRLAHCEAHAAILDRVVPLVTELEDKVAGEWGAGDPYEGADELLVKIVALSYQWRIGYRDEWRP